MNKYYQIRTSSPHAGAPASTLGRVGGAFAVSLLLLAASPFRADGGEVATFAAVYGWPDGTNNFGTYTKASGGTVEKAASGSGWKSYGTSMFHALAAGGSATSPNNGRFSNGTVGGSAYWFEQITISSASVAPGTIGRAEFTLFFDGDVGTDPLPPRGGEHNASISYRWAAIADGADNVPDPNVGESYHETVTVFPGAYIETTGANFRNQPRHHSFNFRFGQPFDFTVALHCSGFVPFYTATRIRMDLRCTGWNGFRNIVIRNGDLPGIPVGDAVVSAGSGFNYSQPSTATYSQWASLYQLPSASRQDDTNGNGLSNLLEFALGRNPLVPFSASPVAPGLVEVGGNTYHSLTFVRPRLGGRPADVIYTPKCSTNLDSWSSEGLVTTAEPTTPDSNTETVTVRSTQPSSAGTREFLRLDVSQP